MEREKTMYKKGLDYFQARANELRKDIHL